MPPVALYLRPFFRNYSGSGHHYISMRISLSGRLQSVMAATNLVAAITQNSHRYIMDAIATATPPKKGLAVVRRFSLLSCSVSVFRKSMSHHFSEVLHHFLIWAWCLSANQRAVFMSRVNNFKITICWRWLYRYCLIWCATPMRNCEKIWRGVQTNVDRVSLTLFSPPNFISKLQEISKI